MIHIRLVYTYYFVIFRVFKKYYISWITLIKILDTPVLIGEMGPVSVWTLDDHTTSSLDP